VVKAARIAAGLRGSQFATPDDVKSVAPWVMAHRLLMSPEAALDEVSAADVVRQLLADTPVPR
jgi:MoxR-like ATPase